MRRAIVRSKTWNALREWLQLRSRLREERRFHLDRAAAEFRCLGMSRRAAKRSARLRFGDRRHSRAALRELGGDATGLACLLRAHRVFASAWLQPGLLLAVIASILLCSPDPRAIIEGVIGTPLAAADRDAVVLLAGGWTRSETAVDASDFETLRTLPALRGVERYQTIYVRARTARGISLAAIQSAARARTGNRSLWAGWLFSQNRIVTGPAEVVWVLILSYAVFLLCRCAPRNGKAGWLAYGFGVALLHALTSITAWALTIQIWDRALLSAWKCSPLLVAYMLVAAIQFCYWWSDLRQRCPVCLDRLVLPLTEGTESRVLLGSAVTQSVCAHGHGVLVESRWSRRFRPEESPLRELVRV